MENKTQVSRKVIEVAVTHIKYTSMVNASEDCCYFLFPDMGESGEMEIPTVCLSFCYVS